jgi:hypothetical protein
MNKRYILIAGMLLLGAILACNRTVPTATPGDATPAATRTPGDGTPLVDTGTPLPSASPSTTPFEVSSVTPTESTPECRYDVAFVADVTIPDDTELEPGTAFAKTWRMSNSGTCAWEPGVVWSFDSGDKMDGPDAVDVPVTQPGDEVDITVNLHAPVTPGSYAGYWKMRRPNGELFGTPGFLRVIVIEQSLTATPTPSATGEPGGGPTILFFQSDVDQAYPGDVITLSWDTQDATRVSLYHLMATGQLGRLWEVDARGSFDYPIGISERNATRFLLIASDDEQRTEQAFLSILLYCPDEWFFEPAPDECPAAAALISDAAEQHFEHGTMIWIKERGQIYVLFGDENSPRWSAYADRWEEGDPINDPEVTPPPGRYQPVRGFGLIWREEPGVRDRLGWAVDLETPFTTAVQSTSRARYNDLFVRALDGNLWKLLPEGSGWEKVTVAAGVPQGTLTTENSAGKTPRPEDAHALREREMPRLDVAPGRPIAPRASGR